MKNLFAVSMKTSVTPAEPESALPRRGVAQLSEQELDHLVGGFALSAVGPLAPLAGPIAPGGRLSFGFNPLGGVGMRFGGLGGGMASLGGVRGGGLSASGAGSE
ncbi:MAG: hypothetical protein RLZZ174_1607 [Pseudomonadota bacterium]|jgi:hypothetical protein